VVLLSPDDTGYSHTDGEATAKPRARQNVILELGFFLGTLGRARVLALRQDNVENPSDLSGILYTPYDSSGAWQYRLTHELKGCGYNVTTDSLYPSR
jgi:predicted nucleotide-binding protein